MTYRQRERRAVERDKPHGEPGQLNAYVLDADSYVTGYGAHNRIVAGIVPGSVYVREDRRGLPDSTEAQRLAVMRAEWPGIRVRRRTREESADGRTIYFEYDHLPDGTTRRRI